MSSERTKWLAVLGLVAGGFALGHVVSRARAAGVPAMAPVLTYAGVLTDTAGAPLSGSKNIQVKLWDHATAGSERCSAGPAALTLVAGNFQLGLDACADAIRAQPDLWAELFVDGGSVGRSKLGAAPYALEADHAAKASAPAGALAGMVVPKGMIAMFAGACPAGWTEYMELRGRFPRGEPAGDPAALDGAGNDDAIVVAHGHGAKATAASAGGHGHALGGTTAGNGVHTHDISPSIGWGAGAFNEGAGRADGNSPAHIWGATASPAGQHAHDLAGGTAMPGGAHAHEVTVTVDPAGMPATGANLPRYREVIFCSKS